MKQCSLSTKGTHSYYPNTWTRSGSKPHRSDFYFLCVSNDVSCRHLVWFCITLCVLVWNLFAVTVWLGFGYIALLLVFISHSCSISVFLNYSVYLWGRFVSYCRCFCLSLVHVASLHWSVYVSFSFQAVLKASLDQLGLGGCVQQASNPLVAFLISSMPWQEKNKKKESWFTGLISLD